MSPIHRSSVRNLLLRQLSEDDFALIAKSLAPRDIRLGEVLQRAKAPAAEVFFIEHGIVSSLTILGDGSHLEIGIAGHEGLANVACVLGSPDSYSETICQRSGRALVAPCAELRRAMAASPGFMWNALRFAHVFHGQVAQTSACNARHDLPQRLARWLLAVHDRSDDDALPLTHDFIAVMLGVRRPTVSLAVSMLEKAGVVRRENRKLTVVDRAGLEEIACECHEFVSAEYKKFFGDAYGGRARRM